MKKLILLLCAGMLANGVNAQSARPSVSEIPHYANGKHDPGARVPGSEQLIMTPEIIAHAKATQTVIGSVETFSAASFTANWHETAINNSQHWIHSDTGAANTLSFIPDLASPSESDGFAAYDAYPNNTNPAEAVLYSNAYNLSGHTNVGLVFNQWFERFNDSCEVDVSTTSNFTAGSTTRYQVYLNNTLSSNGSSRNTDTVVINISAAIAANPSTVYVRFHYYAPSNAYGWGIDDMRFVDLDAVNFSLHRSVVAYIYDTTNGYGYPAGMIPISFAQDLKFVPITFMYNNASAALTSQSVNASVSGGPAYSQSLSTDCAINGYDSAIDFSANPYVPNAVASCVTAFSSTKASFTAKDSVQFRIDDSSWTEFDPRGITNGAYWLHRPASANGGERSWNYGADFRVPQGRSDTLTSANVVFYYKTDPGVKVQIQIWKFDPNITPKWNIYGITYSKTLTTNDISPQNTPTWSGNFYVNEDAGSVILDGGPNGTTYAAVITPDLVPANNQISFYSSAPAGFTGYWGSQAAEDSSVNDATQVTQLGCFGQNIQNTNADHLPWSNQDVPMIKLNFGSYIDASANVQNVGLIERELAYPNPAENSLSISFRVNAAANTSITISNAIGQQIKMQDLGTIVPGQLGSATFNTSDMANGVYFYTINANGQNKTGRFVITH